MWALLVKRLLLGSLRDSHTMYLFNTAQISLNMI
jgi:hypothetical protein